MTKTSSEIYFENLCADLGISLARIPEGNSETPDYELTINQQLIITEVKEMARNKEEQESDRVLGAWVRQRYLHNSWRSGA
jgi:hypothetical protein